MARLDENAAPPGLDPHFAPVEDPAQAVLMPEDRLDQLVEAARDDDEAPALLAGQLDELPKARPDVDVLQLPFDDFVERLSHRLELSRDHFAKRHAALVEPVLDLLVDDRVTEATRNRVEEILFGSCAVEVDDQGASGRRGSRRAKPGFAHAWLGWRQDASLAS